MDLKCSQTLCVDFKTLIHMQSYWDVNISPCKVHFYEVATKRQSHSTYMVPPVQLHPLPFDGNACRSYRNFVDKPLHPSQPEMPFQTPSARPEYMAHTGMWCPFYCPFCHTCVLHTLCSAAELVGGGNPFNLYNTASLFIENKPTV